MNYSTILHVIGQEIESLRPEAYEVVCYGNSYLVRCRVKPDPGNAKEEEKKVSRLPAFLRLWKEKERPPAPDAVEREDPTMVELFYYLDDIKRLDEKQQAGPSDPNAMPDPYSFSYTLSAVGELADRKPNARLLFVSNRGQEGQKIVILYETERGRTLEEYPISGLYDLWVQKYMRKKQ